MKILLLQLKRIGDLVLTTPAITALRNHYPDAHIILAISNECAELLPAISNVDRVLVARRNLRDVAMVSCVAGKKFEYCIDFTRNDRSAFLTLLSGARKRIASYRVREQSKTRARVYTDLVEVRVRDMHTVDYHLALLEPLDVRARSSAPRLDLPQTARENADRLRRDSKITRPYVVLHPGSARREKMWDAARWADVINHFGQDDELDIVLTSGPSADEQGHIKAITKRTRRKFFNLSGKTDLLTLAALIGEAQLLVTVDSAPVHFGAASHTPQVVLFGPTNPFHWRPTHSPALILHGKSSVPLSQFAPLRPRLPMSEISTEAVISAMDSLLPRRAAAHIS
ncbi:MAG TPA: putative lipopolysaccharide heptosyltransferase III [Chthoniobacterales bacterium]|nr:putative lipopolysaccharide heptosyltransferase III [Chthoniobacterales bacterium]